MTFFIVTYAGGAKLKVQIEDEDVAAWRKDPDVKSVSKAPQPKEDEQDK
jgi:hypothetical protein